MSEGSIDGESGAYVPCLELASPFPDDPVGAITGSDVGFVPKDMEASAFPADPVGAITGSDVGYVEGPCDEPFVSAVFAGIANHLETTVDLVTFTPAFTPFGPTIRINSAAWSPTLELFVIVGETGNLATSPDGTTWTARTSTFGTSTITRVIWVPELALFVIVGVSAKAATSPDGITWTAQTVGLGDAPGFNTGENIADIAWSGGVLVVVGDRGDIDNVAVSGNGTSWSTDSITTDPREVPVSIAWSPALGLFVAGGGYGNVSTSSNGTTWTTFDSGNFVGDEGPPDYDNQSFVSVDWSPALGLFAMIYNEGTGGGGIVTSSDSINWTRQFDTSVDRVEPSFNIVKWVPSLGLFLVGGTAGVLYSSVDGINWTHVDDILDGRSIYAIAWFN